MLQGLLPRSSMTATGWCGMGNDPATLLHTWMLRQGKRDPNQRLHLLSPEHPFAYACSADNRDARPATTAEIARYACCKGCLAFATRFFSSRYD